MTSHYGKAYNGRSGQETNRGDIAGKETYKALLQGGDSGFSALLGGRRHSGGDFYYLGYYGYYWSSTGQSSTASAASIRRSVGTTSVRVGLGRVVAFRTNPPQVDTIRLFAYFNNCVAVDFFGKKM